MVALVAKQYRQVSWLCRRRINQLATNINGNILLDCTIGIGIEKRPAPAAKRWINKIKKEEINKLIIYLEQPMQYFTNIIYYECKSETQPSYTLKEFKI